MRGNRWPRGVSLLAALLVGAACGASSPAGGGADGGTAGGGTADGGGTGPQACRSTVVERLHWRYEPFLAEVRAEVVPRADGGVFAIEHDPGLWEYGVELCAVGGLLGRCDWRVHLADAGVGLSAGEDGSLLLATPSSVARLRPSDGGEIWRADVGTYNRVLAGGGAIYVPASDGLVALDAAAGGVRWRALAGQGVQTLALSPDAGVVYATTGGMGDGAVHAVGTADGASRWSTALSGGGEVSVAPDGRVLVMDSDGVLRAFAAANGSEQWQVNTHYPPMREGLLAMGGVVAVNDVVVATCAASICAFGLADGAERWRYYLGESAVRPRLLDTGAVVTNTRSAVIALDPTQGTPLWSYQEGGAGNAGGVVPGRDGRAYVVFDGVLLSLDTDPAAVMLHELLCTPCQEGCSGAETVGVCRTDGMGWESEPVTRCEGGQACLDARCTTCTPHDSKFCAAGTAYWQDSCGRMEELVETCGTGETCFAGECGTTGCDLTCSAAGAALTCAGGSPTCSYGYDIHGRVASMACEYSDGSDFVCTYTYDGLGNASGTCSGEGLDCRF